MLIYFKTLDIKYGGDFELFQHLCKFVTVPCGHIGEFHFSA